MRRSTLKKSLFVLLFAVLLSAMLQHTHLSNTAWAETVDTTAVQDIANKSLDGTVDNVQKYAGLSAAITAIGSNVRTLLIPVSKDVTSNLTVPSNVTLLFWGGGKLNISNGVTVTITGPVQAPLKQIFTGAGTVSFSGNKGRLEKVYPQWWGAKADAVTNDAAAIQAAVNAAATMNGGGQGGTVFFSPGRYNIKNPVILPRTGSTPTKVVRLQGAGMRDTVIGTSGETTFPQDRALIEWEAVASRAWHQWIKDMTFQLPNVPGVSAVHYDVVDNSSQIAILSETIQIDLENILIEGSNSYHQRLVWIEGNIKVSTIENIYGDCGQGTSPTYDTTLLEVDSTYPHDDASGFHYSVIHGLQAGLRRGGWHQVFKGRLHRCSFTTCMSKYGSRNAPAYEIINSQLSAVTDIGNIGRGEKPQFRFSGCNNLTISAVSPGSPMDIGTSVGNGIEFINTDDCIWTGHYRRSGNTAFNSSGVKNLVLDASSGRNRFYNFLIVGTAAGEIQDSGTDNYGEFYDVSGVNGWQYAGKLRRGSLNAADLSGISGLSGSSTIARNLRGSVTVSGTATGTAVTFGAAEADAAYFLTLTPVAEGGTPAAESRTVRTVTKTAAGFTVNLAAAPGAGNSVTYDWHLIR
ncbi:MAG: glycosyl hydrolase family 28-related protein [bacterium]|nr:glycosyl hydrolase family 28-related protein [bacterium]